MALVFILAVIVLISGQAYSQSCHLRELELCAATVAIFVQNPSGDVSSDKEINRLCSFIKEANECRFNYTRNCLEPQQIELVDFFLHGVSKFVKEFCSPNTELRNTFKKHGKCLLEARTISRVCLSDLQSALEVVFAADFHERLELLCCSITKFRTCNYDKIENHCGEDALNFVKRVVKMLLTKTSEYICDNFSDDFTECSHRLPATGTAPTKGKSNNVLNRIFSTYFGL